MFSSEYFLPPSPVIKQQARFFGNLESSRTSLSCWNGPCHVWRQSREMRQPMIRELKRRRAMKQLADTDDSVGGMGLRLVDSIVSVGVRVVVAGIGLFALLPPGSLG